MRTATARVTSASRSTLASHAIAVSTSPIGAAPTSVATVTGTDEIAGEGSARSDAPRPNSPRRRLRGGAPIVSSTSTNSGSPACPRRT